MTVHAFERRARDADRPEVRSRAERLLTERLEAQTFRWTERGGNDDKHGIDVWAWLPNRRQVGIDVKDNRWGEVRLEYVSRFDEGIPGWTVDDTKLTDYVLNLWPRTSWLIDFPSLKAVAKANRDEYGRLYGRKRATSSSERGDGWQTHFIPVPVTRLLLDIYGYPLVGLPLAHERECPRCGVLHPIGTTCADSYAPWAEAT